MVKDEEMINISVSYFGAELRVVIVRPRPRFFPFGHKRL